MIFLSCCGKTIGENIGFVKANRKYIDGVELRADYLEPKDRGLIRSFPGKVGIPSILTFRKPEDGGACNTIDEKRRCELLAEGLSGGFDYVDIEDDAPEETSALLVKKAEEYGTSVIKSFHDFDRVPDNLYRRMVSASAGGRYIPKAAVMPRSSDELFHIVEAARKLTDTPKGREATSMGFILLGMGEYGFPTRVLAKALGSMLTFCSPAGSEAAPGHVSPEELSGMYGFGRICRNSRVYGILGSPVMHSKSPAIHNGGYRKNNIDAVYVPFQTETPEVIIENAGLLNIGGLSITVPHKERVINLAQEVDSAVISIGACNTLVNDGGRKGWKAYNTDWKGFLSPLSGLKLGGKDALVIGAGGAARAVVYALVSRHMRVTVLNRTVGKAAKLAEEFGCDGGSLEEAEKHNGTFLVVQTTSVGMTPAEHLNPLPDFDFSGTEIAYDLIYSPEKTIFLKRAEASGCRIINGYQMLTAQAEEQFRLFTGYKANFSAS